MIGNVERVANLFVVKNVMSLVAILAAALVLLPFLFPAATPDAGVGYDHRHPGVLPRAGAEPRHFTRRASQLFRFAVPAGWQRLVSDGVLPADPRRGRRTTSRSVRSLGSLAGDRACGCRRRPRDDLAAGHLVPGCSSSTARPFRPWKVALVARCVGWRCTARSCCRPPGLLPLRGTVVAGTQRARGGAVRAAWSSWSTARRPVARRDLSRVGSFAHGRRFRLG